MSDAPVTTDLPANTPAPEGEAPAPETPPAPKPEEPKKQAWTDPRINNLTRARREAEDTATRERQRADQAEQRAEQILASLPDDHPAKQARQLTPDEIARQAEQRGAERARTEERERQEVGEFVSKCNGLAEKLHKDYGEAGFKEAAQGWSTAGLSLPDPVRGVAGNKAHRELVSLILGIEDGHKVFHDVGRDREFVAYLLDPSTPQLTAAFELARRLPAAQAQELRQDALEAAAESDTRGEIVSVTHAGQPAVAPAAPAPRVSSAPRPPTQPAASRKSPAGTRDIYDPSTSMDEFVRAAHGTGEGEAKLLGRQPSTARAGQAP